MSQNERLPVTSDVIQRESSRDNVLARMHDHVANGWKDTDTYGMLKPLYSPRKEITLYQGCLLWGIRVIVPIKLRKQILNMLHESHTGVVRIKAFAQSSVWWPGIYSDIKTLVKQSFGCQKNQNIPAIAPLHPWEWHSSP
jgi:hypothetical protein